MTARKLPDAAYLRECLDYDPDTGIFRWRTRPLSQFKRQSAAKAWNTRFSGKPAGTKITIGYLLIGLDYVQHQAQLLAWLLVHGEPVPEAIWHIDGERSNNRIANLRPTRRARNSRGYA